MIETETPRAFCAKIALEAMNTLPDEMGFFTQL
jgi:hypothetical protein